MLARVADDAVVAPDGVTTHGAAVHETLDAHRPCRQTFEYAFHMKKPRHTSEYSYAVTPPLRTTATKAPQQQP